MLPRDRRRAVPVGRTPVGPMRAEAQPWLARTSSARRATAAAEPVGAGGQQAAGLARDDTGRAARRRGDGRPRLCAPWWPNPGASTGKAGSTAAAVSIPYVAQRDRGAEHQPDRAEGMRRLSLVERVHVFDDRTGDGHPGTRSVGDDRLLHVRGLRVGGRGEHEQPLARPPRRASSARRGSRRPGTRRPSWRRPRAGSPASATPRRRRRRSCRCRRAWRRRSPADRRSRAAREHVLERRVARPTRSARRTRPAA